MYLYRFAYLENYSLNPLEKISKNNKNDCYGFPAITNSLTNEELKMKLIL